VRVLIVKVSSLGDVIHTLPAVTDAHRARPDIVFDWVVEENFSEVPSWHPGGRPRYSCGAAPLA
jgi:heptosyltransferase-1